MDELKTIRNRLVYLFISLLIFTAAIYSFCSCAFTLQNISTHGNATDLVDDTENPEISPRVNIPPL